MVCSYVKFLRNEWLSSINFVVFDFGESSENGKSAVQKSTKHSRTCATLRFGSELYASFASVSLKDAF